MGLDIYLNRPHAVELDKVKDLNTDNVVIIEEDNKELKIFEKFFFEKEISYYDLKKDLNALGHDENNLLWNGTSYSEDTTFEFINTIHPLYECKEFLDKVWSLLYCNSRKDLFKTPQFIEFKEKYLPLLVKYGFKRKYGFYASGSKKKYYNLNAANDLCRKLCSVKLVNPSLCERMETCLVEEEIGYQRKGANKQFYEDKIWDHPPIVDFDLLLKHWELYFSSTPEDKESFKINIIDKFIPGKTYVEYC